MLDNDFYKYFNGEIYLKSKCIDQEKEIAKRVDTILCDKGYVKIDPTDRIWQKDNRKIISCFVDDFGQYRYTQRANLSNPRTWFDNNMLVITDNHLLFDPAFEFLKTPDSYYGIYSYEPAHLTWSPKKNFHFSVNRISENRQIMLLELIKHYGADDLLEKNHINFNAYDPNAFNITAADAKNNFYWSYNKYRHVLRPGEYEDQLVIDTKMLMPIRTHSLTTEQADISSWLTVVMETYLDNDVIALSEKTFRALSTPAPWIGICSRGTIKMLESLGFDTLSDVVDHSYNELTVNISPNQMPTRFKQLITHIDYTVKDLKSQSFKSLKKRVTQAAEHNRNQLATMKQTLYTELDDWFVKVSEIC